MAVTNNCVFVSCDRCGRSEYHSSKSDAEQLCWYFNVDVGFDELDLCPECGRKWYELARKFLYGEDKKSNSKSIVNYVGGRYQKYDKGDEAHEPNQSI